MNILVRYIKKSASKRGLPPGSIVHIGEKKTKEVKISIIDYSTGKFDEKEVKKVQDCFEFKRKPTVTWINVDGLHDVELIEKLGTCYEIHPLVLEDIVNTDQRPKMEDFDNYIFFVLKMLYIDEKTQEIHSEQVSLILGKNYVISFQERVGDVFDSVRERIRNGKGRIRKMEADYLAYALVDAIVDHYFIILEKLGEEIEFIEEELITDPRPDTIRSIHDMKKELIFLRKSVWPLREVISDLERGESSLIHESTIIYLRDVYDHTIRVIEIIETFRDMVSGMIDMYISSVSNKMNEIMKVLTIIATIFIPLTFIAGVYGMNFEYMPELGQRWSYPFVWLIMVAIGILMFMYFRKKHWL